ncbi:DIS3-like exonuclease 2 [Diabrotica virgifera virgifera]|uniref:DIS3-like exonuclease 2 n=1 Tax=Diabrotica virgifera virgifera TaxID=50390 RepID=A0A6P7FEZ9_DIAVI|nr:DIS3-like exonuclease 2 [Diabrotica virgifera virgifera]
MSNPVSQCADFLQQLSISTIVSKSSTVVHMVNNPANNPGRANVQVQHASNHHRDRELQTAKKVRRKPRHRNRHKQKDDEDDGSRHSVSSNCSRSSSNFRDLPSSPSTSANKSTNNPRQRLPSASTNTPPREDTIQVTFSIQAVTTNTNSKMIRQRNVEDKFINLRSFIESRSSSCLFITPFFKKSANRQKTNKVNCRKYAKKESRRERKKREQEREQGTFSEYMDQKDIDEGLANGTLVKGFIRINPKNARDSYVNNEDSSIADYNITSISDRNRALEGDQVVLQVITKKEADKKEGDKKEGDKKEGDKKEGDSNQNPAKVVAILQKIHSRTCIGFLKWIDNEEGTFALFAPRDKRFPPMRISELYLPAGFKDKPKKFETVLFMGKLLEWEVPSYAKGILLEKLGESGNLQIESLSILRENNLDITPFSDEIVNSLPDLKVIPEKEFEYREDLRKKCIFTIDPESARDLDDAVSVESLRNGNLEVGVHISDAAFYLEEGTELDQIVARKATTIYLVDKAYHMLPSELCLASSLLPGEDKLSFSVFWEMTQDGDIVNTRFTRSVVNSCAKLAYEHAQSVIENPDKEFSTKDFPQIYNGFEPKDLVNIVNILQGLAVKLGEKRIQNGALRIDKVKLSFSLDPVSGEPVSYSIYENKESHRLIEEFMLLANISVAQKIYDDFPEVAFLRCHEPPKVTMLTALQDKLAMYGMHLDISSSGAIATSVKKYMTDDFIGKARAVALNHFTSKAMIRAQYFCASFKTGAEEFKHYALSIPIYTHFTSPIRRYADIMVHRLLAASLGYTNPPKWDAQYVEAIATNCNLQKYQAKKAGDASMDLYLAHYIENGKPCKEDCVVVEVREDKIDVVVLKTGSVLRIYANSCPSTIWTYEDKKLQVHFLKYNNFEAATILIDVFSVVKITIRRKDSYSLYGRLLRPQPPGSPAKHRGAQNRNPKSSEKPKKLRRDNERAAAYRRRMEEKKKSKE